MRQLSKSIPAYLQMVSLWMQVLYAYRFQVVIEMLAIILKIFLFRVVWTAIYAERSVVDGIALSEVITMTTVAHLQMFVLNSNIPNFIHERVRDGKIAIELARPVPFVGYMIADQIGSTIAVLPFIALALPLALVAGGIQPPASAIALLLYLLSLVLAFMINNLIGTLLGMMSFWTMEIWGIRSILHFVSMFFSGAMVPLWFFPPMLRTLANWLPFQSQAFLPISIYLGRMQGQAVLEAFAIQVFWIVLLLLIVTPIWRHAMRRVVVQGG